MYKRQDADLAAQILREKIKEKKRIRIIGDYDIDGIQSTYILYCALRRLGADADFVIPDRILDGYGLNEHLVTRASQDGIDTILTCDNGISAIDQIHLAKSLGMTVVVTDHHEVPFTEVDGLRRENVFEADAVVNPKQQACHYPFKNCLLYTSTGKSGISAGDGCGSTGKRKLSALPGLSGSSE